MESTLNSESNSLDDKRFSKLLGICTAACSKMSPLIRSFYSAMNSETSKLKADASVFTIADGLVQAIITEHLLQGNKFAAFVGEEEDSSVNLKERPYFVDDLPIPTEFHDQIDALVQDIDRLSAEVDGAAFRDVTVFIDPIDGTREFASGKGEQCSICIGFANAHGHPVAGLVFRPIPSPPTYAAGCLSERFTDSRLDPAPAALSRDGLLTTNGAISPFLDLLLARARCRRVPSGGVGNKMLMLLEGKGAAYVSDRGVSRWDTAAAQAVLEAHGGALVKLAPLLTPDAGRDGYRYQRSPANLDFVPGLARLTPYNCADASLRASLAAAPRGGPPPPPALDPASVRPYANLCGLVAVPPPPPAAAADSAAAPDSVDDRLGWLRQAALEAAAEQPPSYD